MGGSQCEPTGVTPQLGVGGARYPGSQLPVHHSLHIPESSSLASSCHHSAQVIQGELWGPVSCLEKGWV